MTTSGRAWVLPGLVALAAAVSLGLVGQLATTLVRQCLAVDGVVEWLGVHLALLRTGGGCPEGSLAVGGGRAQVVAVLVVVLVSVALAHLVGASLGLGLAARAHRLLRAAAAVVAHRRLRAPRPVPVLEAVARVVPAEHVGRRPTTTWGIGAVARRGPPAVGLA